jgi:hypothetical protein
MDSLKFHLGPPCPTLLRPAGGPPMKKPFQDGLQLSSTLVDTPHHTPIQVTQCPLKIQHFLCQTNEKNIVFKDINNNNDKSAPSRILTHPPSRSSLLFSSALYFMGYPWIP